MRTPFPRLLGRRDECNGKRILSMLSNFTERDKLMLGRQEGGGWGRWRLGKVEARDTKTHS
jgi:hypothetical protein